MPLGPVFRHEMLAAGRKRRYFIAAALVGGAMLGLLAIGYQIVSEQNAYRYDGNAMATDGTLSIAGVAYLTSTFYIQFAWATMIGVLVITPAVAAGAIATERERRTIEYLFATDLSNAEIVLDKLAARLLVVAKLIAATLPVLAIFRLLGGVPGDLLLIHFAMLASTATLVAAMALTVSVWCERARDAVPRAIGVVFLWLIALPLITLISWQLGGYFSSPLLDSLLRVVIDPVQQFMQITNPLWMMGTAAGVSSGTLGVDLDLPQIRWMIGSQLLAAGVLLTVSVLMVRRVHLRAASSSSVVRVRKSKRAPSKRPPFESSPMIWKELFAASAKKRGSKWATRIGVVLLVLIVGGPLVWTILASYTRFWAVDFEDYLAIAMAMSTTCGSIVLLLMGARAAGLISYEQERDTWLSLLTTPLTSGDILMAKTLGNFYAFRWALVGVAIISLVGALLDPVAILGTLGVMAVMLVAGWATTAIGLAFSLRMTSSVKAVGATTLLLLAIGVFYTFLAAVLMSLAGFTDAAAWFVFSPCIPFLLTIPLMLLNEYQQADYFPSVYFSGLVFYAVLGTGVAAYNRFVFDRVCGRGAGDRKFQPAPPTSHPSVDVGGVS